MFFTSALIILFKSSLDFSNYRISYTLYVFLDGKVFINHDLRK